MSTKKKWDPPGWPWELELVTFALFVIALAVPYYLVYTAPNVMPEGLSAMEQIARQTNAELPENFDQRKLLMLSFVVVGLYIAHLVIAGISISFISTPFTSLISPVIFGGFGYYLVCKTAGDLEQTFPGCESSGAFWTILMGSLLLTAFILARVSMARHLFKFKDTEWAITSPSKFDSTYFRDLLLTMRPLFYPPRKYRVGKEGILILGWLYVIPISFKVIQSIVKTESPDLASDSQVFATNSRHMIRIQLLEHKQPFFISPDDTDRFFSYCQERMEILHPPRRVRTGFTRTVSSSVTQSTGSITSSNKSS